MTDQQNRRFLNQANQTLPASGISTLAIDIGFALRKLLATLSMSLALLKPISDKILKCFKAKMKYVADTEPPETKNPPQILLWPYTLTDD
jgi:hypothetical protein